MSSTDDIYKTYEEHMKTLRAWYVGYGVGGPVLFVTQPAFAKILVEQDVVRLVGALFLLGVLFQVLLALLNKWVNWGNYNFEKEPDSDSSRLHRFCSYVARQAWIDILADVATLVFFAWATVLVVTAVSRSAGAG